jgi:formamidopyrimidine-DNA glycosylase
MPELPEVETIKKQLEKSIVSKKIKSAEILYPRFINVSVKEFQQAIAGAKIKGIRRRAKLLIIDLSNSYSLLCHLKMTGQLIHSPKHRPEHRGPSSVKSVKLTEDGPLLIHHTHIVYRFANGDVLIHSDIRKFGYVKLMKTSEVESYLNKAGYGIEPLEKEFSFAIFKKIIRSKPQQKIKQFLLDQKNIAGIGNIYADEICFYAGVRPDKKISELSENEIKKIFLGIKKILTGAIKYRGSSISDYRDSQGRRGEYQLRLKVYGRHKEKCAKCGNKIQKTKLFGRGTHFCPKCQK